MLAPSPVTQTDSAREDHEDPEQDVARDPRMSRAVVLHRAHTTDFLAIPWSGCGMFAIPWNACHPVGCLKSSVLVLHMI